MDAKDLPQPRSIRLQGHNYASPGWYFLTICTAFRLPLFGRIVAGRMALSKAGALVDAEWRRTPAIRSYVQLDAFVIMPDHIHGIVVLVEPRPVSQAIGSIVRGFKAATAAQVRQLHRSQRPVWQRSYYERVLRDDEIELARSYILMNPSRAHDEWSGAMVGTHRIVV